MKPEKLKRIQNLVCTYIRKWKVSYKEKLKLILRSLFYIFFFLQNKLIEKIGKIYKTDTFYILDNCSHVWKSTSKYNSVYLNKYSIGLIPTSK
jgi:hypothetical protein